MKYFFLMMASAENVELEQRMAEALGVTVPKKQKTNPDLPENQPQDINSNDTTSNHKDDMPTQESNVHPTENDDCNIEEIIVPSSPCKDKESISKHTSDIHDIEIPTLDISCDNNTDPDQNLKTFVDEAVIVPEHNDKQEYSMDIEEHLPVDDNNPVSIPLITPSNNATIKPLIDSGISDTSESDDQKEGEPAPPPQTTTHTADPVPSQNPPAEDDMDNEVMGLTHMDLPIVTSHRTHSPEIWVSNHPSLFHKPFIISILIHPVPTHPKSLSHGAIAQPHQS